MELSEIRNRILETEWVSSLPIDMQKKFTMVLLWLAQTEEVSREQILFTQGDTGNFQGCLILEGMVRIITEESEKESERQTSTAPDFMGEIQLFTPQGERTATVEVVVGGEILSFGWEEFSVVAREIMSADEMALLNKLLLESAMARKSNVMEKIRKEKAEK